MENAAEALKIAFAVMLFVMALTLSMSSFSQATKAVQNITTLRDRESEYTYVKLTSDFSRTVGIESVTSSIYRSKQDSTRIYFFESDGKTPIVLYYAVNSLGQKEEIEYIDYTLLAGHIEAKNKVGTSLKSELNSFLDILIGGKYAKDWNDSKYQKNIIYTEGIYEKFKNLEFEELLGEYEESQGASKVTKRVITYIKQ